MSRENDVRGAIDRMAVRIRDSQARTGKPITHEKAKEQARKIAIRVDRKSTK